MEDAGWLDADEQAVFRAFSRPARRFFVAVDRDLRRDVGVSRAGFEILWLLAAQDPEHPLRMGDLADALGAGPSRVTQAVDRMEAEGWVRRQAGTADARVQHATVTEAGVATLRRAAACHARSVRTHLLDQLDEEDRQDLVRIGDRLLSHLTTASPGS